jgi:hypothetical protein
VIPISGMMSEQSTSSNDMVVTPGTARERAFEAQLPRPLFVCLGRLGHHTATGHDRRSRFLSHWEGQN